MAGGCRAVPGPGGLFTRPGCSARAVSRPWGARPQGGVRDRGEGFQKPGRLETDGALRVGPAPAAVGARQLCRPVRWAPVRGGGGVIAGAGCTWSVHTRTAWGGRQWSACKRRDAPRSFESPATGGVTLAVSALRHRRGVEGGVPATGLPRGVDRSVPATPDPGPEEGPLTPAPDRKENRGPHPERRARACSRPRSQGVWARACPRCPPQRGTAAWSRSPRPR